MKKIRKLFLTAILLAVCACCAVPLAACDTLNADDWKEVQSITYTTESGSKTLVSVCVWDTTKEEITKEEYDNAPATFKAYAHSSSDFPPERTIDNEFLTIAKNAIGTTDYYSFSTGPYKYAKITYNSYTLKYVKVKFNKNGSLDIDFDGHATTVVPITYEITYFEN